MVRAFGLYCSGIRFQSLSSHYCWVLSKFFIPSIVLWSVTKNNAIGGEKESSDDQSDRDDLDQVSVKPQPPIHHYLTNWLQIGP